MSADRRLSTGISGVDAVLHGGVLPGRAYMLRGAPGTGKTIFGLHYLQSGSEVGDRSLYISFEEGEQALTDNADRLGIDLEPVEILDLSPTADAFDGDSSYSIFDPSEVERESIVELIRDAVEAEDPDRVVIDPITRFGQLSRDQYQLRTQIASFMSYLTNRDATVLFTTQPSASNPDDDFQYLADGAIELGYAEKGRTLTVRKFRGSGFQSGTHTVRITENGMEVYPELIPRSHSRPFTTETLSTGVNALDSLLHGGIERGTITVLSGSSGVGKSTTATHLLAETAARGDRSVAYLFEEVTETFTHRAASIGIPISEMREAGTLTVEEVEPLAISPDEFAAAVREEVESNDVQTVLIDGISGYRLSIRGEEDDLVRELHALCKYLKNMGVTTVLTDDIGDLTGSFAVTSTNISYIADNILFLRYIEVDGELQKAIGVLKKRISDFERTLRTFSITDDGIVVGEPLRGLRGILTGTPQITEPNE